ncbi:MAG: PAS domain-containing protein, partial [Gemmatimonadales bacterium]
MSEVRASGPSRAARRSSIVERLMLGLTVTIAVSSAITVGLFAVYQMRTSNAELERSVDASITDLARSVEAPLWDLDMGRAARVGDAFASDPRVVRLTISEAASGQQHTIDHGAASDTVWRTRKVMHEGRPIGEVGIAFSRAQLRAQVRQQDRLSAAVTLVTLFAVLLVVRLLVGRLLNRPLAELSDIVGAYEIGDYTRSAASIRYVEFRQFGAVLDSMRQKIRGQLDELQAANVRLSEEALVRQRAHEAERLLRAAIEQTPDSVVISDTSARIVYVNPAFTAVTGYTRDEAVGASTRLLESGEHDEVFFAGLWEKLRNGATWHGHLVNQKKGGERFVEDAIIAP